MNVKTHLSVYVSVCAVHGEEGVNSHGLHLKMAPLQVSATVVYLMFTRSCTVQEEQ